MHLIGEIVRFDRTGNGIIRYGSSSWLPFSKSDAESSVVSRLERGSRYNVEVQFHIATRENGQTYAKGISFSDNIVRDVSRTPLPGTNKRKGFISYNLDDTYQKKQEADRLAREPIKTQKNKKDVSDDSSHLPPADSEQIALGLFDRRIRLVSLASDGGYRFLDGTAQYHNIVYPSFFEELSLQLAIEELEDLVNDSNTMESHFQNFFERHQDFILNDEYKQAHPHIILSNENRGTLIPDFILEPVDQNSFCDLLELKLPRTEIYVLTKNRERFSAAVFDAAAQLREYGKYFDDETNQNRFRSIYPHLRIYKPRMFVIVGRQNDENLAKKREIQSGFPELYLRTYDELLARMKWKRQKLGQKNKLF